MKISKTIVITGATRGLGLALVKEYLRSGHRVFGCGRSPEKIGKLNDLYAPSGFFSAVDVTDAPAVESWSKFIIDKTGAPDYLINNAALMNNPAPLWQVPPEEFSALVDVNIKGLYHCIRAFLPAMIFARRGVVINFSSGWGRSTAPEVAPYCASKWAVEGLTKAMSQEIPPGLAVVSLNPGVINTDMLQSCWPESASAYPTADQWAVGAAPFLLNISTADNGCELTVPTPV